MFWILLLALALVALGVAAWRRKWLSRGIALAVERRLGGYLHEAPTPDEEPENAVLGGTPTVAVIGGGLAGIGAATTLAERGISVTLFEAAPYLGGKIGAWTVPVGDSEQTVEHGFHAFFRQYYNLNRFLDRLGLRDGFREIEDYLILDDEGRAWSFGDVSTVPALNIIDLGRKGFFRWRDVVGKRTRQHLDAFVRYDGDRTYEALDHLPFARFCDDASLPKELRISFRTFARAFFAHETDLSTAAVLRAFHFYYLSHAHGLMYDYPMGDYETALLAPIRAHLDRHGVELRLGSPVNGIGRGASKRFEVCGRDYDWVVLAADIPGMQKVVEGSDWMREVAPAFVTDMRSLRTSNGYAVWRIWVDRDVRAGLPTFINVDHRSILDSVTLYHRITEEARAWAEARGGAVLELHSYALPAGVTEESEVRRMLQEDLEHYFPELREAEVFAESLQVRHDFPSYAPGQQEHRPAPKSPIEGLWMAGDWVRLPYPMTHMEAAFTSGLVCANAILESVGLQAEPIYTVAPRGLLVRSAA